ncbi:hypothetical protein [Brevundimonas sp.]|uniref:hypothetical protein n=1 Tax=Brevundimonas sp. TaxID=1871086 RepID=UPI002ED947F6
MKPLALTGLALGLTAAGAGGWAAWNSTAIAHREVGGGELQVEVVAPREPDLPVGAILAVGDLRDDYVHDPDRLQPPAVLDADYAYTDNAWAEPEPSPDPLSGRADGLAWTTLRPPAPIRLDPHDYSFGFDQPPLEQATDNPDHPANPDASTSDAPADTSARDGRGLD